jgi:ribose-phosphate pyrophosphokinase
VNVPADGDRVVVLGPDDLHRRPDVPAGRLATTARRTRFPDGEQLIALEDPAQVAGRHALVVQSTAPPQEASLMTALQLLDAVRSVGPLSITCFVPYLCYQRQDRRGQIGEALSGSLVTGLLAHAGATLVLTVDKHSPIGANPPGGRVVSLSAAAAFAVFARALGLRCDVVVSPDRGGGPRAQAIARQLGTSAVALDKHKSPERGTFYRSIPPELAGRDCLIVDDLCSSGSSLDPLCRELTLVGARLTVFVTHLLMSADRLRERIPAIQMLAYSDSCGDRAAPVRLLPVALDAWDEHLGQGARSAQRVAP